MSIFQNINVKSCFYQIEKKITTNFFYVPSQYLIFSTSVKQVLVEHGNDTLRLHFLVQLNSRHNGGKMTAKKRKSSKSKSEVLQDNLIPVAADRCAFDRGRWWTHLLKEGGVLSIEGGGGRRPSNASPPCLMIALGNPRRIISCKHFTCT